MESVCSIRGRRNRRLLNDTNIYRHAIAEVLVTGNEGCSLIVLKADAFGAGGTRIQTVEILDGCHNGVGSVMWVNAHSHGQARTILRRVHE